VLDLPSVLYTHLKQAIEENYKGREDEEEELHTYWITSRKKKIKEIERRSTESHCMQN
jgi:hypothetical protein